MLFFSSEPSRRTRTQIRNEEGLHYDVRLLCRTEGQPLDEKIDSKICERKLDCGKKRIVRYNSNSI